jgi:hypothetical protein
MKQDLQLTVALLERTPAVLDALLRGLPDAWTLQNEGENTMSPWDVVGHLIHAERMDWIPRAKVILSGERKKFEAFDRWGHTREWQGKPIVELLDEFARLRRENLAELRAMNVDENKLAFEGQHPSLGAVRLSELLATWATHDLTHLHQISRVLAHQYREAVGPWSRYLGVLQCAGHSAE